MEKKDSIVQSIFQVFQDFNEELKTGNVSFIEGEKFREIINTDYVFVNLQFKKEIFHVGRANDSEWELPYFYSGYEYDQVVAKYRQEINKNRKIGTTILEEWVLTIFDRVFSMIREEYAYLLESSAQGEIDFFDMAFTTKEE